jgi:hypothetical protein
MGDNLHKELIVGVEETREWRGEWEKRLQAAQPEVWMGDVAGGMVQEDVAEIKPAIAEKHERVSTWILMAKRATDNIANKRQTERTRSKRRK